MAWLLSCSSCLKFLRPEEHQRLQLEPLLVESRWLVFSPDSEFKACLDPWIPLLMPSLHPILWAMLTLLSRLNSFKIFSKTVSNNATGLHSASYRSNYDLRSPTSFPDHTIFTQLSNDVRTLECSLSFIEQNLSDDAVDGIPEQFKVKLVEEQTKILTKNEVIIGSPDLKANHAIHQHVEIMSENQKYNKLVKLLEDIMDGSRILIFMDIKKGCDQITRQLRMDGWLLCLFMETKVKQKEIVSYLNLGLARPIMTATDVAARGLDVKYVINYDFPGSLED
ncbi:uncharacterized protein [Primulina eburnea]|uniref:uncharacterized protein n=1 Tax=Primulina eburnea TaxID=1245227 RepID=UPI003C6CB826